MILKLCAISSEKLRVFSSFLFLILLIKLDFNSKAVLSIWFAKMSSCLEVSFIPPIPAEGSGSSQQEPCVPYRASFLCFYYSNSSHDISSVISLSFAKTAGKFPTDFFTRHRHYETLANDIIFASVHFL